MKKGKRRKPYLKKEWLLLLVVVGVTLTLTLGLIRWYAPQLLGIPIDLQTVRVSKEVPAFYENIFRKEDFQHGDFLLKDPFMNVRARPLFYDLSGYTGPHDILGFRNMHVPNVADVVVIGDSQTYGNNAFLSENWPSQLIKRLASKRATVYSMATGGWGGVQYAHMAAHATVFLPRVLVIAFYSGNDPQESVSMAYSDERWSPLRPETSVNFSNTPPSPGFPPPESEHWQVRLRDGTPLTFTPSLRLVSNDSAYETVRAGYQIMEKAARFIASIAEQAKFRVIFTVIPTKELVYAERLQREGISLREDYKKLITLERDNISRLVHSFRSLPQSEYVDLVVHLQQAALGKELLYPENMNGHPIAAGYRAIAEKLSAAVTLHLRDSNLRGLVVVDSGNGQGIPILINSEGRWTFGNPDLILANGWKNYNPPIVTTRDIVDLPVKGVILVIDPQRFGPSSFQ